MKRLIFTLCGALAVAAVLVAPGCSFGPDKYSGPFIDEPPPPDDMAEGATAGTVGMGGAADSVGGGGAAGADNAAVGGAGGAHDATAGAAAGGDSATAGAGGEAVAMAGAGGA